MKQILSWPKTQWNHNSNEKKEKITSKSKLYLPIISKTQNMYLKIL